MRFQDFTMFSYFITAALSVGIFQCLGVADGRLSTNDAAPRWKRFPSVEDRVKLYMSNWYSPPCPDYSDGFIRYEYIDEKSKWPDLLVTSMQGHPLVNETDVLNVHSIVTADKLIFLEEEIIRNCANRSFDENSVKNKTELAIAKRVKFRMNMRMYCHDVKDSLLVALNHIQYEKPEEELPPILLQFGDSKHSHVYGLVNVPHIKKFRSAVATEEALAATTPSECTSAPRPFLASMHGDDQQLQPIVWKLATHRHFDKLYDVYSMDTTWKNKKDMAIFRGQLTGAVEGFNKHLSDQQNCQNLKRCRLVYNHANSTLIDALLTNTRGRLPLVLDGVPLVAKKVDLSFLLQYKGIIMIEGNDVASGLKWALLSQSVVLMPPPKHTSWAMEELLVPWVHYVPLNEDITDVAEKMQWVVDNDEKAQRIAQQGTLWMEDLVFHPDAAEDDRLIQEEILRRYVAHFEHL